MQWKINNLLLFHFILQLDNEEPADDDSDFDEYDSVFLPI